MKLEQKRLCQVALIHPTRTNACCIEQLNAFLSRPLRPLRGLLDPARLQPIAGDCYTYLSSPYGVAGWTLRPRVTLRARWTGHELHIEQVESRVDGLGSWQDQLRFGLEAWLRPVALVEAGVDGVGLEAESLVWAELPAGALVMAGPLLNLGLQQLLDRLERRCQRGLRRRAEAWLAKDL